MNPARETLGVGLTKILKLEAKGFKSFANKTELVFGDTFNVILGPNGSGKSNVFDAICFVLGKSGAKGLRAEKTVNLLYNGGKSKQAATSGEVSIYLDNEKKEFPLHESVIKITRSLNESGLSTYRINDKKHTREQVIELLSAAAIDPNGYNIILQGDIVRLVEMSPVERRQIIEEIAGISVYEDKKQKALNELQKIEANINEAEIILNERRGYLKELKKERDQALEYKELQQQVKSLRATVIHLDIKQRTEKVEGLKKESGKYGDKINAIQNQINELKTAVDSFKKQINAVNKEIEEKGEKSQVELHKEVEKLKVDLATQKANIDGFTNEIDRIKSQKSQFETSLSEIESKLGASERDKKGKEKDLQDNVKLQKELTQKIADFKKKNNLEDASGVEDEIAKLDQSADVLEREISEMRIKQQELIREKDRLELQISSTDEKINKVLEVSKENASEIDRLKKMKNDFKQAALELQKCLTKDASLVSQLTSARGKIQLLQEELGKYRVQQASLAERLGGNAAIKAIKDAKDKFGGVFGTVVELGVVDRKYALALDIAAGNRINSIVVKDDKVAADCIKYLRDQKLGVATFLPLNKIKGPSSTQKFSEGKGIIGFAIDLVKFDKKFEDVFKYVFSNTLVVEDIDVARRIGVGTVRMVTLEGDLIDISGSMRGGFIKKMQGSGFQENRASENITKAERELADFESVAARVESERRDNQKQIDDLREKKATLEGEIIKTEKSLHLDSGDLGVSKQLKQEFTQKLASVDKDLESINGKVSTKNRELANFKIEKQKMRAKIMDMRNPTKIAELTTFQEKLQSLKSDAIRLETEVKAQHTQMGSLYDTERENLKGLIKTQEAEESSIKQKVDVAKKSIQDMQAVLKEKEKAEKEFYAAFKQQFALRNQLQEKIEKEESKIIKLEEDVRGNEQKNTVYSLDIARYSAEMGALEQEFAQYKDIPLLNRTDYDALKKEAWTAEQRFGRIGNVNMRALEIYDKVEGEFKKLDDKKAVLSVEREKILVMINEIDTKKKEIFLQVFDVINQNFQKIFQILSTKGKATMQLETPQSPFDGGVLIKVLLKGTKFLDIRSLSGGEKTLTALAFIFAVQEHNPASFYVFDEVDAALDKRNSEKLASLIRSYSSRAQYVVVSHNDGVISAADRLYGVSMDEHGISKVVSLRV